MDQIITFNKTFQDRLAEYHLVFGDTKLSSIPEIKNQWSLYLEFELEVSGWQAFWKIPHSICSKNNIPHPTIVLVQINQINYEELDTSVEIVAIQGDIDLNAINSELTASLIDLWPTKQQPTGLVDGVIVADALEKLRFFYNNVLLPFDYLDSSKCDGNLQERLSLYYSIKENTIAKSKTVRFRALLKEIRNEFEHYDRINFQLDPTAESIIKIIELKMEYELLQILPEQNPTSSDNNNWLIFSNKSTIKDHLEYLDSIKYLTQKNEQYQTAISLESALEQAQPHDTIYMNQGSHVINSAGILKDGVSLRSVSNDPTKTTINTNKENALIEFIGDQLSIENTHLNVSSARCAIIAHCGQISLKNCIISGHQAAEHAIIALPGAKINLENCKISGFNVGLYASSNTVVSLIDCSIFDVSSAIKLFDDSKVCLFNCVFENVARSCIYFETKHEECRTGDETLLKA